MPEDQTTAREKYKKMLEVSKQMMGTTVNEVDKMKKAGKQTADMKLIEDVMNQVDKQMVDAGVTPAPQQQVSQATSTQSQNETQLTEEGTIKRNIPLSQESIHNQKLEEENKNIAPQKNYSTYVPPTNLKRKYDLVPLPSNGQCYKDKRDKIPVYYMTAKEENFVFAINLYANGLVIDSILRSCIVDEIDPNDLIPTDVNAILIFLRSNAYGVEMPFEATNPYTGQKWDTTLSLADIKYKPFDLVSDENGYFTYTCKNGDIIKFHYPTRGQVKQYEKLLSDNHREIQSKKLEDAIDTLRTINAASFDGMTPNDSLILDNSANSLTQIKIKLQKAANQEEITNLLTITMLLTIASVNGNFDRLYCQDYIENMLAREARDYRSYIDKHAPQLDFTVPVVIPEGQEGAGETYYETLPFDDTIFLQVAE